jgi:hypothetical protein
MGHVRADQHEVLAIHRVDRVGDETCAPGMGDSGELHFPMIMPAMAVAFPRQGLVWGLEQLDLPWMFAPAQEPERLVVGELNFFAGGFH